MPRDNNLRDKDIFVFKHIIKIIEKDPVVADTLRLVIGKLFPKVEIEIFATLCSDFSICERGVLNTYMVNLEEFQASNCNVKCVFDNIIVFYESNEQKEKFESEIGEFRKHYYFVKKPFHINSLIKMAESALIRLEFLREIGDFRVNKKYKEIASINSGNIINITDKELEILEFLYTDNCRPKGKEELLKHVWGYGANIETHTLETYIYRLRIKLEKDQSNPDIIKTSENNKYYLNL